MDRSPVQTAMWPPDEPAPVVAAPPRRGLITALVVAIAVLVAGQIWALVALFGASNDLSELRNEISVLGGNVGLVESRVGAINDDIGNLTDQLDRVEDDVAALDLSAYQALAESRLGSGEASPAPNIPNTGVVQSALPAYPQSGQDPAVGLSVGTVSGVDAYAGETMTFGPDDGKARAWMIWAHWCPYCQQELPYMTNWYISHADEHEHFELVSVTTSMDPSRGNPLEPYLEASSFPFPVLVDTDGSLARQFGVTAFPFWVFTGPDGTVLQRVAGLLPEAALESAFTQLDAIGREAAETASG